MITKVNILIDGGFFERKFYEANRKSPTANDVVKEVNKVMQAVIAKTNGDTKDILFRVFYYDCKPFGDKVWNYNKTQKIDFAISATFLSKTAFLKDLAMKDKFALRLGELSFDGWKNDLHNPRKSKVFKFIVPDKKAS